jgi:hypothetical protein
MNISNYLSNLINEKANISMDTIIEVEGPEWGTNFIPLESVVEYILSSGGANQKAVMNTLTKIDFMGGDVLHVFNHVAKFMAK